MFAAWGRTWPDVVDARSGLRPIRPQDDADLFAGGPDFIFPFRPSGCASRSWQLIRLTVLPLIRTDLDESRRLLGYYAICRFTKL